MVMFKRIIHTCAFFLIGAITTVGVAWSCVLFSELKEQPDIAFHITSEDKGWWFSSSRGDGLGATHREVNAQWAQTSATGQFITPSNNIRISDGYLITDGYIGLCNFGTTPPAMPPVHRMPIDNSYWSRLGDHHNFDSSNGRFVEEEAAYGWPMYAMWCSYYTRAWEKDENGRRIYQPAEYEAVLQIPESLQRLSPLTLENHYLPLQPISLGFAGNTAIYASAWWIALVGIAKARRHLRRAKGKCISCAYDLRGITSDRCPECGFTANCT